LRPFDGHGVKRAAGARQTARECAQGDFQNSCRFLVGYPFNANKRDKLLVILRELSHRFLHPFQGQPAFDNLAAVRSSEFWRRIEVDGNAAYPGGPFLIDSDIMDNLEHPTVQPCARLPLIEVGISARAPLLHEIVSFFCITG
jgi:hypothetical protein